MMRGPSWLGAFELMANSLGFLSVNGWYQESDKIIRRKIETSKHQAVQLDCRLTATERTDKHLASL